MYLLSEKRKEKKRKGIMGRKRDRIWIHAEKLNNHFKCNYCNGEFTGGARRIKYHLARVSGHDIAPCESVPEDIREVLEGTYKEHKGASTSSIVGGSGIKSNMAGHKRHGLKEEAFQATNKGASTSSSDTEVSL